MKRFINLYTILGAIFLFLFFLLIILLNFDKGIITENGKGVGLKSLNKIIEYKEQSNFASLSTVLLLVSFGFIGIFVLIGLYQLLTERSLLKVDKAIIGIGISVVIILGFWVLFDKLLIVNYRPLGELEGSYPSTHILIMTFSALAAHKFVCYVKSESKFYKYMTLIFAIFLIALMFISRILAGRHYITDALGAVFLGLSIYFICFGIIDPLKANEEEFI